MIIVGLTGSHGVGKTRLAGELSANLRHDGFSVEVLGSVTRGLASEFEDTGNGFFELACVVERHKQILSAVHRGGPDVLITERMANDEYGYLLAEMSTRHSVPEGFAETISGIADIEAALFNVLFYKPPSPRHPPFKDGVRPTSLEYQKKVDRFIKLRVKELGAVELDCDLDVCRPYVVETVKDLLSGRRS